MKKILIISFTDLEKDPRVNRQIRFLKNKYAITTVGLKDSKVKNVEFIAVNFESKTFFHKVRKGLFLKLNKFEKAYWCRYDSNRLLKLLSDKKFDLIIANDIETLPFALKMSSGAKILFDAHEYCPREFEDSLMWRFLFQDFNKYLCNKYLKYCNKITTVCDSIAYEYFKNFNIAMPTVISNASEYIDIAPSQVDKKHFKIVYHGIINPSRKIESIIKLMDYLDNRFTLDLILIFPKHSKKSKKYFNKLRLLAKGKSIYFLNSFPMREIAKETNKYDIGICILEPSNFNNKHALPNKFFEFIQARLMIAIGPSPEMAKITRKYDLGVVADDFSPEEMAKKLNSLTKENIMYYKNQSNKVAFELSSFKNMEKLGEMVSELLSK